MKKIFYLLIAFILFFNINFVNASTSIVGPYNSFSECNKILEENSSKTYWNYQQYERSKCYKNNNWSYQYNICKKWEGCINNNNYIEKNSAGHWFNITW